MNSGTTFISKDGLQRFYARIYEVFANKNHTHTGAQIDTATTSTRGTVQPDGTTIDVTAAGVISAKTATENVKGIVQPDGTSININNGMISVQTAAENVKGIVQPDGTSININNGMISVPDANTSQKGLLSPSDKIKLNGVATGATKTEVTNTTTLTITDSTGSTSTFSGMTSAERSKLSGIANNANNYSLPTATSNTLGGIKVGSNLLITNGVLTTADTVALVSALSNYVTTSTFNAFKEERETNFGKELGDGLIVGEDEKLSVSITADDLDAYSKSEVNTALSGKANKTHSHSAADVTTGTLPIARGGTGLTSSPSMLANLGSTSADNVLKASPRPGVTGTLNVAHGGTGATTAANARANLGAAASSHSHSAEDITSGTIDIARIPTGSTASTVALGNHTHPTDTTRMAASLKGSANGVAELDSNGLVPTSQLPSFVDDVLEYSGTTNFPITGETGKIYVDTSTNKTYRWSGSSYTEISASLALGETSSTAYRGDHGKAAYDHISDTTVHITAAERTSWNAKTSNTGTVTSVGTGIGLTGGTITGSGTVKAKLKSETAHTASSATPTNTGSRQYAVGVDKDGYLSTNVPWIDTTALDSMTGTLGVNHGGTGATTATGALTNLGAAASSHSHAASDIKSGTLDIARIPIGSTASTVALGNHTHSDYQTQHTTTTASLTTAGWLSNSQTINVAGVTSLNTVIVAPAPESAAAWMAAEIICTAQGAGTLTFTCTTTPSDALTANVLILA